MNTSLFPIAIVVFLICVVVSRVLNEKAFRLLDAEQKVRLLDAYSGMRAYSLAPILLIFGVMWGLPLVTPSISSIHQWSFGIGMTLMLIYIVALHWFVTRKLASLELPSEYTRQFLFARHISHVGVFIMFAALMFAR